MSFHYGSPEAGPSNPNNLVGDDLEQRRPSFALPQKSSLIDVLIDEENLPTEIRASSSWRRNAVHPSECSELIMNAYRYTLFQEGVRRLGSGHASSLQPSLREMTPMLLQTRTYSEYRDIFLRLCDIGSYTTYGPGLNDFDEPTLTVYADNYGLSSLVIDVDWAAVTDIETITADIIDCSNQIRLMRPRLPRDEYLDRESDEELNERLAEHLLRLRRLEG